MGNKKILFIGSFNLPENGQYGGVYFASTTLRDGLKKDGFQIIEMDTTLKNIAEARVSRRLPSILYRQFKFLLTIILNPRARFLFVFLSGGGSYIDKFLSIVLAKFLCIRVIVFPRSGHLIKDYDKKMFKFFINSVLKMTDKVVCQSTFWEDYFTSKNVDVNKLTVIENWVDPVKLEDSVSLEFPNFESQKGMFKIVFLSRIEKTKGINDIIELGKKLKGKINFSIHVYGAGSYQKELIESIKANNLNDIIFFEGWLEKENILNIINSFHLAVFPSQTEGYPNGLLDYIFSKIPILSTNIPMVKAVGNTDLYYYEVGNINQMSENVMIIAKEYNTAKAKSQRLYDLKKIENSFENSVKKLKRIIL